MSLKINMYAFSLHIHLNDLRIRVKGKQNKEGKLCYVRCSCMCNIITKRLYLHGIFSLITGLLVYEVSSQYER